MDLHRYHSSSPDPYQFSAEKMTEAQVVDGVITLNSYINHFIWHLVITLENRWKESKMDTVQETICVTGLPEDVYPFLANENCATKDRFFILEALWRDAANKMIYDGFFEGDKFFGIESAKAQYLEEMYKAICIKEPWCITQHWRSLSIAATFKFHDDEYIDSIVDAMLDTFTTAFQMVFPTSSAHILQAASKCIRHMKLPAIMIFRVAEQLSFSMQKDVSERRMKIIVAPKRRQSPKYLPYDKAHCKAAHFINGRKPKNGEIVIATHSYGLLAVGEMHQRTLIKPQVITNGVLPT